MNIKRVSFECVPKVVFGKKTLVVALSIKPISNDTFEKKVYGTDSYPLNEKYNLNPYKIDKNKDIISFRGLPYKLESASQTNILSGDEALNKFENFKLGNYLDINGNPKNIEAKKIREENLSFLDRVRSVSDKKQFIDGYNALTGFPDMAKVSQKIQQEFINACKKSEEMLMEMYPDYKDCYKIVSAGFDGISSTSKNTAFPGSDLDKAYIILQGSNNDLSNEITVSNFKWRLWENTDQRILSYNHDVSAFPEVYTVKQINSLAKAINKKVKRMNLHGKNTIPGIKFYRRLFKPQELEAAKYDEYKSLVNSFDGDYVRANKFIVDVAKQFPRRFSWADKLNCKKPSREDIYKAGYILESIEHGKQLIGKPFKTKLNSDAKDLINLSQIRAIKSDTQLKAKYKKRKGISQEFKKWDTEKQFSFIKAMIKASCADNEDFEEYFQSSEEQKFSVLLDVLGLKS